jgi:outer membrane protein assembly factor BamE (lipoprotein component of BamABCDE complex)
MKHIFLVALMAVAIPAWAQSNEQLARDSAELRARVTGLEARVAQLESRSASVAQPQAAGKALDMDAWRKCKAGLTKEQVVELLGKATTEQFASAVNQYPDMESWYYGVPFSGPGGSVTFMGGKVVQCLTSNFTTNHP